MQIMCMEKVCKDFEIKIQENIKICMFKVIHHCQEMYSLAETFEKQIKAIGDQGEKQIKTLEEHGKQLVKSNTFAEKEEKSIPLDKQTVIFYNLNMERTEEIVKLHNTINFQNLIYHFKGPTKKIDFNDFIDA